MLCNNSIICLVGLVGMLTASSAVAQAPAQPPAQSPAAAPTPGAAQEPTQERFFAIDPRRGAAAPAPVPPPKPFTCTGPIARVIDVGLEGRQTTTAVFGTNPGGGEGGQFDRTPLMTTNVVLEKSGCLNAHLTGIVGGKIYSTFFGPVSNLALFQVTLTRVAGGTPRHMVGHYETPYGFPSPAVALEAERDVDMLAANFFQKVGTGPHEVPAGNYRVDVWWAGAPPGAAPGGAIGFSFVLKLYLR